MEKIKKHVVNYNTCKPYKHGEKRKIHNTLL